MGNVVALKNWGRMLEQFNPTRSLEFEDLGGKGLEIHAIAGYVTKTFLLDSENTGTFLES